MRLALAVGVALASGLFAVVGCIDDSSPSSCDVGVATVGAAGGGCGSLLCPCLLFQVHGQRTAWPRKVDCCALENCPGRKEPAPAKQGGELVWTKEEESWLRREPTEESSYCYI